MAPPRVIPVALTAMPLATPDVAKLALDALQVTPVSTGVVAQVTVAVVVPS